MGRTGNKINPTARSGETPDKRHGIDGEGRDSLRLVGASVAERQTTRMTRDGRNGFLIGLITRRMRFNSAARNCRNAKRLLMTGAREQPGERNHKAAPLS